MRNRIHAAALVEGLETRRLLSGAVLSHGILRVFGDGASTNTITVNNSASGMNVDVSINSVNARGVPKTFTKSFAKSAIINSVWVVGGAKNDTIRVGQSNGAFTLGVRVLSGGGDDNVTTGAGNDIVFAGAGNDTVNTGEGMDWVRGMLGNDIIDAGNGNDRVNAGSGNDAVNAGGGADMVRGESGDDLIDAGSGDDVVYGGLGNDTLLGGTGNDLLWGGVGDDNLSGGNGNDTLGGYLGTNVLNGNNDQDTFVVRQLTLNPNNDYRGTEDILLVATRLNEGGHPPAA
jgi:Ca2+-binding RTX toxin-like protein